MPSNPFSSPSIPGADKAIAKNADALRYSAQPIINTGKFVNKWIASYDKRRAIRADAAVNNIKKSATKLDTAANTGDAEFRGNTQPLLGLQSLDAAGASWLSPEAQKALIDRALQTKLAAGGVSPAEKGQLVADATQQKRLIDAQKGAENSAVGMATGDAAQAEARNLQGITSEAAQMGIDPSRVLATHAAHAADNTAGAVDAAMRARFGVRDQRTQNLNTAVNAGLQAKSLTDNERAQGIGANNSVVSNLNQTGHEIVADKTAALPWYQVGLDAYKKSGDLAIGKTQADLDASNAKAHANDGTMSAIGSVAGIAAAALL